MSPTVLAMVKEEQRLRLAIIAGATHAIKYLEQHKRATHDEAIRHVVNTAPDILTHIDEP